MGGVGGGVWSKENDIRLGDVVVSQPGEIRYMAVPSSGDFGKVEETGGFQRTATLNKPPSVLLHALQSLKTYDIRDAIKLEGAF
jgi:hypothetical protein